jgi:hypothetical protein|tara:strand:+ start:1456 stop:2415 length:960 start_codon:yes stop_codon:yes gene_type:complete
MSHDLEEKFVSDDGVSTVEDPTTPEGGTIKKKKADVAKKVNPKAEKVAPAPVAEEAVEDEAVEVVAEEVIEYDTSIAAMFEGMDLSEDFTSKVTLVFEAAVNEASIKRSDVMIAEKTEALAVSMKEASDASIDNVVENLDSYLDYVVEEWMTENSLAIEAGIKVEMAESLMDGLATLFEEHNIEINEDTVDVVAGLEEEVEGLKADANKAITENVTLAKEIASLKADAAFEEMTEGLTLTQVERLKVLSEKLAFDDIEAYKSDLTTLKESFFAKSKPLVEEVADEEEIIVEDTAVKQPVSEYSNINALLEGFNRMPSNS